MHGRPPLVRPTSWKDSQLRERTVRTHTPQTDVGKRRPPSKVGGGRPTLAKDCGFLWWTPTIQEKDCAFYSQQPKIAFYVPMDLILQKNINRTIFLIANINGKIERKYLLYLRGQITLEYQILTMGFNLEI